MFLHDFVGGILEDRHKTNNFVLNIFGLAIYESYKSRQYSLTEVAGEGGTDCPPQKFLSSQKFRHLMG